MAIVDLKKISCTFLGVGISTALGVRTIKNWGSDKADLIKIDHIQPIANIVKTGSSGDSLTMQQYDTATMKLTIKVGVDTDDDKYFKNIQALHMAGSPSIFSITYRDENTNEIYASISGTMETFPPLTRGTDIDNNRVYVFNMPETIYTPPTL